MYARLTSTLLSADGIQQESSTVCAIVGSTHMACYRRAVMHKAVSVLGRCDVLTISSTPAAVVAPDAMTGLLAQDGQLISDALQIISDALQITLDGLNIR